MEIVCVLGSPKANGNSASIAKRFCDKAEKMGGNVQCFNLNELDFKGCQGCMACKTTSDRCVLKDDLTQVLDAIRETDILVIATPVYFADMTGQLKCFLDRTYSFSLPDYLTNPNRSRLPPGKKGVFIMTQGAPEGKFVEIYSRFETYFKRRGFKESLLIEAGNLSPMSDTKVPEDIMELAEKTAEKLMR